MNQYTGATDIITNIGTKPDERGLTTDQFKAKFDEGLQNFVSWFNNTHKTEFESVKTAADNNTSAINTINSRRLRNLMGIAF